MSGPFYDNNPYGFRTTPGSTIGPNKNDIFDPDPWSLYQDREIDRRNNYSNSDYFKELERRLQTARPEDQKKVYDDFNKEWQQDLEDERKKKKKKDPSKKKKKKKKPKIKQAVPKTSPNQTPSQQPPPLRPPQRTPPARPVVPEAPIGPEAPKDIARRALWTLLAFPLRSFLRFWPWTWLIRPSQLADGTIPDWMWEEWSAPEQVPSDLINTGPNPAFIDFVVKRDTSFAIRYRTPPGIRLRSDPMLNQHWVVPTRFLDPFPVQYPSPIRYPEGFTVPGTPNMPGRVTEPTTTLDLQIDGETGEIIVRKINRPNKTVRSKPVRARDKKYSGKYKAMLAFVGFTIGTASEAADFLEAMASNVYTSDGTRAVLRMTWDQAIRGLVLHDAWHLDMPGAMASWMTSQGNDRILGRMSNAASKGVLDAGWNSPLGLAGKVDQPSFLPDTSAPFNNQDQSDWEYMWSEFRKGNY